MLSQSTLKSYHKTQIDPERLAPAVSKSSLFLHNFKLLMLNEAFLSAHELLTIGLEIIGLSWSKKVSLTLETKSAYEIRLRDFSPKLRVVFKTF